VSLRVILFETRLELELARHDLKLEMRFVVPRESCSHRDRTAAVATRTASSRTRRELKLEIVCTMKKLNPERAVTHERCCIAKKKQMELLKIVTSFQCASARVRSCLSTRRTLRKVC